MRARDFAAVIALLAGCFPTSPYDCDQDFECSGGELCARTHECLPASAVRPLRVTWTVAGEPDLATGCTAAGLTGLTITYQAPDATELTFTPVQCVLGLYAIDKLPTRFDRVELWGYSAGGTYYAGAVTFGPELEVAISL